VKTLQKHLCRCLASFAAVLILAGSAFATTFSATDSLGRSAEAIFSTSGTNLVVQLTNTANVDITQSAFVLTALFFDGANNLNPVSALLAPNSIVFGGPNNSVTNLGGEWAYVSGLNGAPHSASAGISSSGLGIFGGANFHGNNLQNPVALDGVQYGITTAGDNPSTGNGGMQGQALIKNSVIFTLSGLAADFDLNDICNVSFQYGTGLTEPNITPPTPPAVPEPGTMVLWSAGAFLLAIYGKRRRA